MTDPINAMLSSELTLRLVPGAVGEHKTAFFWEFQEFREKPTAARDLAAVRAVLWTHTSASVGGI